MCYFPSLLYFPSIGWVPNLTEFQNLNSKKKKTNQIKSIPSYKKKEAVEHLLLFTLAF